MRQDTCKCSAPVQLRCATHYRGALCDGVDKFLNQEPKMRYVSSCGVTRSQKWIKHAMCLALWRCRVAKMRYILKLRAKNAICLAFWRGRVAKVRYIRNFGGPGAPGESNAGYGGSRGFSGVFGGIWGDPPRSLSFGEGTKNPTRRCTPLGSADIVSYDII